MRILMINKFLYPNGGSETYIFKLGEALEQHGHEVQYFGMEHEGRCVWSIPSGVIGRGAGQSSRQIPRWNLLRDLPVPHGNLSCA